MQNESQMISLNRAASDAKETDHEIRLKVKKWIQYCGRLQLFLDLNNRLERKMLRNDRSQDMILTQLIPNSTNADWLIDWLIELVLNNRQDVPA